MPFSLLFVATCLISTSLASIGPMGDLMLTNGDVAPDGFTRAGDEFNLNVIDQLTNETMLLSTSIHWHGFFQPNNSWADGVSFVIECPIAVNNSFLYTFPTYSPFTHSIDADLLHLNWLLSALLKANGTGAHCAFSLRRLLQLTPPKMRLVSISCDPNFIFTIDGHNMTIIEADGINTQPLVVDSIQIYAGQRYSFVLNADQAVDNYWIRTVADGGTAGFDNGINSAILRYGTAEVGGADITMNLAISLDFTTFQFEINGVSYTSPTVPVLLQILSGAQTAADILPSGSVFTLPANNVVELSIPGGTAGAPRPLHLYRCCHIDFHLNLLPRSGLAIVFAEDTPTIANSTQTTPRCLASLPEAQ
ncbi:laccase [Mycena sanguinolenta]|nr:laccase [Mycena sanguinolenta]